MQVTRAKILKRPKVGDREVLAIEGITQPSLQQTIAYFDAKKNLVDVELQYVAQSGCETLPVYFGIPPRPYIVLGKIASKCCRWPGASYW